MQKNVKALVLMLTAPLIYGCATSTVDTHKQATKSKGQYQVMTKLGDRAVATGNTRAALHAYTSAKREASMGQMIEINNKIASVYTKQGEYGRAIDAYQEALKVDPKDRATRLSEVTAYLGSRNPKGALEDINLLLAQNENDAQVLSELGVILDMGGLHKQAQTCYKRGLTFNQNDITIANNYAMSMMLSGNFDSAIKQFRQALRVVPKQPQLTNNLKLAISLQDSIVKNNGWFENKKAIEVANKRFNMPRYSLVEHKKYAQSMVNRYCNPFTMAIIKKRKEAMPSKPTVAEVKRVNAEKNEKAAHDIAQQIIKSVTAQQAVTKPINIQSATAEVKPRQAQTARDVQTMQERSAVARSNSPWGHHRAAKSQQFSAPKPPQVKTLAKQEWTKPEAINTVNMPDNTSRGSVTASNWDETASVAVAAPLAMAVKPKFAIDLTSIKPKVVSRVETKPTQMAVTQTKPKEKQLTATRPEPKQVLVASTQVKPTAIKLAQAQTETQQTVAKAKAWTQPKVEQPATTHAIQQVAQQKPEVAELAPMPMRNFVSRAQETDEFDRAFFAAADESVQKETTQQQTRGGFNAIFGGGKRTEQKPVKKSNGFARLFGGRSREAQSSQQAQAAPQPVAKQTKQHIAESKHRPSGFDRLFGHKQDTNQTNHHRVINSAAKSVADHSLTAKAQLKPARTKQQVAKKTQHKTSVNVASAPTLDGFISLVDNSTATPTLNRAKVGRVRREVAHKQQEIKKIKPKQLQVSKRPTVKKTFKQSPVKLQNKRAHVVTNTKSKPNLRVAQLKQKKVQKRVASTSHQQESTRLFSSDEKNILKSDAKHYTLVLVAKSDRAAINRIISDNPPLQSLKIYSSKGKDSTLYFLSYGEFKSADEANMALFDLPIEWQRWVPNVQQYKDIQQRIKR